MPVNPDNVDLTHIEDVTDIEPEPTLVVGEGEHHVGSLTEEGKRLLTELLDQVERDLSAQGGDDAGDPVGQRAFDRLGVDYNRAQWKGYDLYWADEDALVQALRDWNSARIMS